MMRTNEEREALFLQAATKSVRKCFSKRTLAKRVFSEEEMKEIKEIDSFLKKVSMCHMDYLEKQLIGHKNYFCVAIRVKAKVCGEELETFVHQYILEEDFDYTRVEYYIAKGIYLANQNKHFEVYYCVNLIRPRYGEGDICMPRRATSYISMTSCIFCDLDMEEPYASMDDETLLATFESEQSEIVEMLHPLIVRSGRGMHLYVLLEESLDLTIEEEREHWKSLCKTLAFLLRDYNADYKVVDLARILRCIKSINRKEKYGKDGKKVELLKDSNERMSMEELEYKLDFLMRGGAGGMFQEILDEIIYEQEEEDSIRNDFFEVDFEDDIFVDDIKPYLPPSFIVSCYRQIEKVEEEKREGEQCENVWKDKKEDRKVSEEERTYLLEQIHKKERTYQGIQIAYKDLPDIMWQNRDLLFWVSNRKSIEGYRNHLLFFLAFNTYYFERVRSENAIYERLHYYNEKYFHPKLDEKEIRKQISICYKKFEKNIRTKYIRNETIQRFFPFEEEEKAYTIGNYYDVGSDLYIEKNKTRHREYNLNYYYEKLRDNQRIDYFQFLEEERKKECKEYIREHPFDSYTVAREHISIGENQYYDLRKEIQKELGMYIDKKDIYKPFEIDSQIKYSEYNKMFPCTRCTYGRRKKRFLHNKDM